MLSSQFEAAATFLSSAPSLSKVSNTIKLEIYGLFKTVTVGITPTTSRPSILDMTGRAKWDAWSTAGKKYPRVEDAETRYIELAKGLGWDETKRTEQHKQNVDKGKGKQRDSEEGDIWDSDEEDSSRAGGVGGLGLSVSTMARPQEASEKTLHGFAVDNDVNGVEDLLAMVPNLDLNEIDEHGYTPLHLAADRGHLEIVKLLLDNNVDKSIKDPDGMTALELACTVGHSDIVSALSGSILNVESKGV